jgi:hypothetical protein
MKLPRAIPLAAAQTRRASDEGGDCGAPVSGATRPKATTIHSGTFEPLLGGNRQKQMHVAKALNPLQKRPGEVSLS